jgi:uncharacterized protein (TIGR03066 family)
MNFRNPGAGLEVERAGYQNTPRRRLAHRGASGSLGCGGVAVSIEKKERPMRWMVLLLSVVFAAVGALAQAGQTDTEKKLVGSWEITKSDSLPKGAKGIVEFTKDGKLNLSMSFNDKVFKISGTYKVKDKTITTTLDFGGKSKTETITVKKLTDTELIIEDEKGKTDEYKRKVAK